MPEADMSEAKRFRVDVPATNRAFFLKGSGAYDWGMQNRLSRVFHPHSGRTVMLAIDHGYFQGPTTGSLAHELVLRWKRDGDGALQARLRACGSRLEQHLRDLVRLPLVAVPEWPHGRGIVVHRKEQGFWNFIGDDRRCESTLPSVLAAPQDHERDDQARGRSRGQHY